MATARLLTHNTIQCPLRVVPFPSPQSVACDLYQRFCTTVVPWQPVNLMVQGDGARILEIPFGFACTGK